MRTWRARRLVAARHDPLTNRPFRPSPAPNHFPPFNEGEVNKPSIFSLFFNFQLARDLNLNYLPTYQGLHFQKQKPGTTIIRIKIPGAFCNICQKLVVTAQSMLIKHENTLKGMIPDACPAIPLVNSICRSASEGCQQDF